MTLVWSSPPRIGLVQLLLYSYQKDLTVHILETEKSMKKTKESLETEPHLPVLFPLRSSEQIS
jgi:hypothetical protein